MQAVLERGDHAEVTAAAAERPEQVCVLSLRGAHDLPVRRHELHRHEAVDREAERALQVPDASAERQPADARVDEGPTCAGQPERLGRGVVLLPGRTTSGDRHALPGVDMDRAHAAEVSDDGGVPDAMAGHAVPAASHRHWESALAGVADDRRDIRRARASSDQCRPPVDQGVERRTPRVVFMVARGRDRDPLRAEAVDAHEDSRGEGNASPTSIDRPPGTTGTGESYPSSG